MFQDKVPGYPDNKMTLGRYLGPATVTGSALPAKILKANGQFVCRTMLRHLNDTELQNSFHQNECQEFDTSIGTHLGSAAAIEDFDTKDLTPDPTYFDITHIIDPDYGDAEITLEMSNNHLTTEIMLPRGAIVKGRVTVHKRDQDGNSVGLTNSNLTLDTCSCIVDFDNGNQTEITTNLIAESLYSQCNPDGVQPVCPTG
jgi:hypothetical protein